MKKIVFWSLLILCVSTLVNQSQAETTSDNLLDNGDFSTGDLSGWTVEDSDKIQYEGNCYNESGLCQSVRWSTDLGKTLSQTIEDLSEGYDIDTIHLDFTALGCNNEATGAWCSEGTDYDKVQAVIQLSNGTNTENLYLEQTLDYNDGTQDYNLSTQTLDAWTTDNTSINFSITGIDTGGMMDSIAQSAKTGYGGYGSSDAAAAAAASGGRDYSSSPGAMAGDMEYDEE